MAKYLVPLDMSKQEIRNYALQNLSEAPLNPVTGQKYYDTALGKEGIFNGTIWEYSSTTVATYTKTQTDTAIANAVLAENTLRTASDTTLQANIDLEITARTNADTTNANAILAEATVRSNADLTLQANINAEITARAAAVALKADQSTTYTKSETDLKFTNLIDGAPGALDTLNELAAAIADDANYASTLTTALGTKATVVALDSEITARTAADVTLQNNINAEITIRAAADTSNANAILAEITTRAAADTAESNTRGNADTTLQANINAEITIRSSADIILQNNINAEITTRTSADTTNSNAILAEITARSSAVSTEITNRGNADTTLQNNINTEITARTNAELTLQANINAEITARNAADLLRPKKISASIGNGAATSININHALATTDIQVSVFETASPYAQVIPDVQIVDANNVSIQFAVAPTTNQYRVVVVG